MVPIFSRYGELFLFSFTITLAVGTLISIGLTYWREREAIFWNIFDAILATLIGAVIVGRAGFVVFNWSYYQERSHEIVQFSQGGFNYFFALGGGLLFLYLWTLFKGISFFQMFAKLAPAFVLFTIFGWTACWLEGCAYGRAAFIGPFSAELPDDFGVFTVRYQTQLFGLLLSTLLFIIILSSAKKMKPALLFWFTIGSISLIHLVTTLYRADPSPIWANLRLDTWLDLLLIGISIMMLLLFQIKQHGKNRPS